MPTSNFSTILSLFAKNVVGPGITLLIVLSIMIFFYGLLGVYRESDSPEARGKYVYLLVYSVLGFAILLGIPSIISLLTQ